MIEQTALEAPTAPPSSTCAHDAELNFKIVRPGEGEAMELFGERVRCVLDCGDTRGQLALHEVETPPDGGPPLHAHGEEDEVFVVLAGRYEFRIGDQCIEAEPGTVVFSPRRVPHTFSVISDEPGQLLILSLPGGCERFFQRCAHEFATGAPRASAIAGIGDEHGISFPASSST